MLNKRVWARWCMICATPHGTLYICKYYPQSVVDAIFKEQTE